MSIVVRVPDIHPIGHYRVLRRTDGILIVVDDRLPLGKQTVWTGSKSTNEEAAKLALKRIAAGGVT